MMYILMHSDISKRDITEDCVFAWSGKTLILLPVNSEEYRNSVVNTKKQNASFSFKNLILGHTYSTKKLGDVIYLGHHDWSEKKYSSNSWEGVGKKHIFFIDRKYGDKFMSLEAKELAEDISTEVNVKYAKLVEDLYKIPNMKKMGTFSVKKGFEKVGYKKNFYEMLRVTMNEDVGSYSTYTLETIKLSVHNDNPKVISEKNPGYWEREYTREIYNSKNYSEVKNFFINKGFGELIYKKSTGEKIKVE